MVKVESHLSIYQHKWLQNCDQIHSSISLLSDHRVSCLSSDAQNLPVKRNILRFGQRNLKVLPGQPRGPPPCPRSSRGLSCRDMPRNITTQEKPKQTLPVDICTPFLIKNRKLYIFRLHLQCVPLYDFFWRVVMLFPYASCFPENVSLLFNRICFNEPWGKLEFTKAFHQEVCAGFYLMNVSN